MHSVRICMNRAPIKNLQFAICMLLTVDILLPVSMSVQSTVLVLTYYILRSLNEIKTRTLEKLGDIRIMQV